jgi:hypothetical protein
LRIPRYNHILENRQLIAWFEIISATIVVPAELPALVQEVSDPFDE